MINVIKEALSDWSDTTDGREQLQHSYVAAALILVLSAGILGLVNYDLGQKILFVAILAIAMFFINAVAWALLQSFVLLKISADKATKKLSPAKSRKKSTKK
ncbi:hypothetical protein GX865_01020 [Candidatus Saccharibacteria bacterium]|nr:hypothetical protein [Candidatus Saccharibacteria bacterium]